MHLKKKSGMRKKNGSLKFKLFTVVFLFVMLWIVILLSIYFRLSTIQRIEESSRLFAERMESMSNQVETMIEEMDVVSSQVLASQTLQKMFVEASSSRYSNLNYFELNIDKRNSAQDILWALNSPQKRMDSINVFCNTSYVGLRYAPSVNKISSISQKTIWKVPEEKKYLLIEPHMDEWDESNEKRVISLVRDYVATSFGFRIVGTIEVQKAYEELIKIFELPKEEQLSLLVMDNNGNVIYESRRFEEEDKEYLITSQEERDTSILSKVTLGGISCMEMHTKIPINQWTVSLSQPKSVFDAPVKEEIEILILVGGISALFISFGLMVLISRITKPVLVFSEDIKKITELKQKPVLHETNVKEIKILQESFQKLIMKLKQSQDELILLHETELNLKILGLQSQINPHFLFNSLNAISSAAMEEKSKKVPLMCSKLGELFRYSSENETEVTLAEELIYMKNYMEFMKWRYEDNFQYEVYEEGNENQIVIARMTLQPLIENCFTHAFKKIAPPYRIHVKCSVKETGWLFQVSDNGLGFPESEISKISHMIENIDDVILTKYGYGSLQTNNMAILNTYIRLKLKYQNQMYLEILQDEELKGAKIIIQVDYLRK